MQTIILASRNPGKIREILSLLAGLECRFVSLSDLPQIPEIAEDGSTFEENALLKARQIFGLTQTPALADDSGLEVAALDDRPGVRSARYAGENVSYDDNNKKLLSELARIPPRHRRARFRCVAAFVAPGVEHLTEGLCRGRIIESPRGHNGFGYDPLFVPDGYLQTFAELSSEIKNSISHRHHAFTTMAGYLKEYLETPR